MDRPLTRRILPALAALLLALAAGGCATKDAGESSADKSIYGKMPASPDDTAFGEFAGIVVGAARICRRYLHVLSDRDEQLQIIQDRFSDWESFDDAAERFRRLTHGVDGWRGNMRAICADTGRKLDDIIARLEDTARTDGVIVNHARVNEAVQLEDTARTDGVIFHSRMENGEPQSFLSRLTLGEMPKALFIRNTYPGLTPGKKYRRVVDIRNPRGKIANFSQYYFTPRSKTWNVWRRYPRPAKIFDSPGEWQIVTRLSGEDVSAETSRILPVVRKDAAAPPPAKNGGPLKVGRVRITYHTEDGSRLFSRLLSPGVENPEVADKMRARQINAFNAVIRAEWEGVRPGVHRYEFRTYEPNGALAVAKGYQFTASTPSPRTQTTHRGVVSYISARPGRWRMEFLLDGEKIDERIIRVHP